MGHVDLSQYHDQTQSPSSSLKAMVIFRTNAFECQLAVVMSYSILIW